VWAIALQAGGESGREGAFLALLVKLFLCFAQREGFSGELELSAEVPRVLIDGGDGGSVGEGKTGTGTQEDCEIFIVRFRLCVLYKGKNIQTNWSSPLKFLVG
jgi:hypothetical protein